MLRLAKVITMLLAAGLGQAALAQSATKIPLELNRLEQAGETCRVYLLVKNPDPSAIEAFKLDLVFFDTDSVIRTRLYVELGPLAPTKTAVRLFDVPKANCDDLASILVNDVVTCTDPAGAKLSCLSRLELSSKASAKLEY